MKQKEEKTEESEDGGRCSAQLEEEKEEDVTDGRSDRWKKRKKRVWEEGIGKEKD